MELVVNTDISASTEREPIYRVIDSNPTFSTVVSNFTVGEYLTIPVTVFSSVLSVAARHSAWVKPRLRGVTMQSFAFGSLMLGFNEAVKNSTDRLMGFLPKDDEVPQPNVTHRRHFSDAEITTSSLVVSTLCSLGAADPDFCGRFGIRSLMTIGLMFGATYAFVNLQFRYLLRYHDNKMKREYPVIDHNPDFSKVVGNFNTRDYLRVSASTGYTLIAGYHFGPKRSVGCWVTVGLLGLVFGFGNSYVESSCRLMGVFLNDDEVARFNKK